MTKEFSVVIPVYGCKKALPELYERLTKSLKDLTSNYEIIFVDDSCPQNSWETILSISKKDKNVIGMQMSRNFGQMKAILAGLEYATGEYIVVMDCDLQDRPEEIKNLYNKLNEGYDVVFARRLHREDNFLKKAVSKMFYKVYSYATDQEYDETLCNFSIAKRVVIDNYLKLQEQDRAFVMYVKWLGFKQGTLDVKHDKRYEGKSSYNFKKRIKMASDILLSQSDKIIKLFAKLGFLITVISFIYAIYLVFAHAFGHTTIAGWTTLVVLICFMSGVIITVVGVVGLYIGRVFMQVKKRPLYIVREVKNDYKNKIKVK